jgi:hypothetical protein
MKKTIITICRKSLWIFAILFFLGSCSNFDWDQNHDTTLSDFQITSTDATVVIAEDKSNINETTNFNWTASKAADYTTVFYKVLFSKSTDFSEPIYQAETEKLSTVNNAELTNDELNIIAEKAGIAQSGTGTIYWTVVASNGIAKKTCPDIRSITITRPSGYAYNPANIQISGKGLERVNMKKLDEGVFEAYVYLQNGDYTLYEKGSKTDRHFGILNGVLTEDGSLTTVKDNKLHHIVIDFNNATASISTVNEMALWYSAANDIVAVMTESEDHSARWSTNYLFVPENNDFRYKFRMTEEYANGDIQQYFFGYASKNATNQTSTTAEKYFYLVQENGMTQSDYCFKFNNKGLHANKNLLIEVDMTPGVTNYTHSVIVEE